MAVEFICKGGAGGEASIDVELRTEFPGIGGLIETYQGVVVANREEYNKSPKSGHKLFLKHAVIKKIEDYFFVKGKYNFAHITRPLGSTDNFYVYEWAFGSEGFCWEYFDEETYNWYMRQLDDWSAVSNCFNTTGIDIGDDCTDAMDGRISKNIIHQLGEPIIITEPKINRLWKRIDFGTSSINIDYKQLEKFLTDNRQDLEAALKPKRYDFLVLATKYLMNNGEIPPRDKGKLEILTLDYRLSTLSHLNQRGIGDAAKEITSKGSEIETL